MKMKEKLLNQKYVCKHLTGSVCISLKSSHIQKKASTYCGKVRYQVIKEKIYNNRSWQLTNINKQYENVIFVKSRPARFDALHAFQWKQLQIAIVLCGNFSKYPFYFAKKLKETQLVSGFNVRCAAWHDPRVSLKPTQGAPLFFFHWTWLGIKPETPCGCFKLGLWRPSSSGSWKSTEWLFWTQWKPVNLIFFSGKPRLSGHLGSTNTAKVSCLANKQYLSSGATKKVKQTNDSQ